MFPDLNAAVEQMKTTAKETASGYDASVKVAGKIAIAMIASWAESLIGEQQRLWFEKSERDLDWEVQARETAAAWEAARTSEARDSLVHELDTLRNVADLQAGKIDQQQAFGGKQLTEQQTSSSTTSIRRPGKGDAILTVAYRLRARISAERRPELIKGFETKLQGLTTRNGVSSPPSRRATVPTRTPPRMSYTSPPKFTRPPRARELRRIGFTRRSPR